MDQILVKTDKFGEIRKNDNDEFIMTDAQVYGEFEKRGLANAKEVLKTVQKTKQAFAQDVYKFLGDEVVKTKQDQFLTAGTGDNRFEFGVYAEKEINIPARDGKPIEKETRYGYCTYREQHKIPEAWKKEGGELYAMAEEIEKAMKK